MQHCFYSCGDGGISASSIVITLRVSTLGFRAFERSTVHKHFNTMKEKSRQKTAIVVGMLINVDFLFNSEG